MRADEPIKQRLQTAAELSNTTLTQFILDAAEAKAEQVLVEHSTTVVPADFFDAFYASLDEPAADMPTLAAAARKPRRFRQV